jgi:hypothetical protein
MDIEIDDNKPHVFGKESNKVIKMKTVVVEIFSNVCFNSPFRKASNGRCLGCKIVRNGK